MTKVLITGAKGQLGYEFERLFNQLSVQYIPTDYEQLDVTDDKKLKKFFLENKDVSHIINCAAYNNVDKAEKDERVRELNVIVPRRFAEIARELDIIFVTYSTDFVFNGEKGSPYKEEDVPIPLSKYGKAKLDGEKEVAKIYNKSYIIRTSWLFGIGGENFNTQIINWSKNKKELTIVDDQISVPTYAKDLAYFTWKLIKTQKFGLYHITNNGETSKYEQAKYLLSKIGWKGILKKGKTLDFNLCAKRPNYSKLSSKKIEAILKEKIPTWQNGIDRFIKEIEEKL